MNASSPLPQDLRIDCVATPGFTEWMSKAGGSLAITTYQAGKVALVGWDGQQVSLVLRQFDKPMGLAISGGAVALATRHCVTMFADSPALAADYLPDQPRRYDALYLPRAAYFTGDLNVHDLAFTEAGLCLVNTRFSTLAQLSHDFSFVPGWRPPFISELAPEDRCHMNGLAVRDGKPAYVTALGESDVVGGWRERKADGGIIIDIERNEVIVRGLSMPHSPRWHEGRLWVLNSGRGELTVVDPASGDSNAVCALPGYLRGLAFTAGQAVVGLCQIRERHIFGELPLTQRFEKLLCGLAVIDLESGAELGRLEFTSGCQEIYDVQFLPGIQRPMILNLEREATRQAFTAPNLAYWIRPSSLIPENAPSRQSGPSKPSA